MDFHTLSRKQLQALCKKNKIPANMTNVAMADSLAALEQVEGIEEFFNPVDTDVQKIPDEKGAGTPACRTSTRRKPVMEEPESSKVSTRLRRGTRAKNYEEIDQENKDLNVPVTPAAPRTRRRAPAVSTRRKKEDEKPTDHVPKTPAASNSRVNATSANNTRKSVRLLDKGLSKMNLMDKEETGSVNSGAISDELSSVSPQMEDSEDTENGASSLAISTEVIEKTDVSELTSAAKNFVDADETESVKVEISEEATDLSQKIEELEDAVEGEVIEKTDVSELTSGANNFVDDDETESVKVEISEEATDLSQKTEELEDAVEGEIIEKNDVSELTSGANNFVDADETESVKVEISEEATDLPQKTEEQEDAVEGANSQTMSIEVIEETDELEFTSSEKKTEFECQQNDSNSEMPLVSEEASNTGANLQAEPQESFIEINMSGSPLQDMNNSSESDVELTKSNAEEVNDAINKSDMGKDIQNSALMLSSDAENEAVVEMEGDKVDDEVDASMMIVEAKNEAIDIQEEMISDDNQNSKEMFSSMMIVETAYDNQNSEEMFSAENKAVETACDIHNYEEMFSDENKLVEIEELGFKASSDIEEPEENAEKDAVIEVCNEPSSEEENTNVQILAESVSSEGNMNAKGVADPQSPLVINEDKTESEIADVQASLVINEAGAESETTNVQSVADSQSPLVTNEAKAESEAADVQSSLFRNEAEAESETADVQIGNEEDCNENVDVPTVTSAPIISEKKAIDVPIQFAYQDQLAPKYNEAVEVKSVTITKMCDEEGDKQKKNHITDYLNSKSLRQLKKMMKNLSIDNETNNNKNSNSVVKEVERKRTALQELPDNRMTASKNQQLLP